MLAALRAMYSDRELLEERARRENDTLLDQKIRLVDVILEKLKGTKDWEGLQGLDVLDIGCGSEHSSRNHATESYSPHFCRICAANGAQTIGIDVNPAFPSDAALYEHIAADIVPVVMKGQLAELVGGRRFDVVNYQMLSDLGFLTALDRARVSERVFEGDLLPLQVQGVLKEGGLFAFNGEWFRKRNDILVRE